MLPEQYHVGDSFQGLIVSTSGSKISNHQSFSLLKAFEEDVHKIHSINQGWKLSSLIKLEVDRESPIARSLKNLKNRQQTRLLQNYAPHHVFLKLDEETESEEPLYSLRIREPQSEHWNAGHLPVRVAKQHLTPTEIQNFS
jgi:hypothetical protein